MTSNKITFYYTIRKTYEMTYEQFCTISDVKTLSSQDKKKAWNDLTTKEGQCEFEYLNSTEEYDAKLNDAIDEKIIDVASQYK